MKLDVVTLTLNPAVDVTAEVEALVPYRTLRAEFVAHDPGGGGINVAHVLHRFGFAVRAVFPHRRATGRGARLCARPRGVPMEAIDSAAPTRESITIWARSSGEHYRILFAGAPLGERAWQACIAAVRAAPRPCWVVLSGSLPSAVPASVVLETASGLLLTTRRAPVRLQLEDARPRAVSHCS
jgi:6-phosphofructokinase 2